MGYNWSSYWPNGLINIFIKLELFMLGFFILLVVVLILFKCLRSIEKSLEIKRFRLLMATFLLFALNVFFMIAIAISNIGGPVINS